MKDVRFYAEMPESRMSKSASKDHYAFTRKTLAMPHFAGMGNCIAVFDNGPSYSDKLEGIGPVYGTSNSPVGSCSPSRDYLRKRCIRVPESLARHIHPRLFATLDRSESV